MHHSGTICEKQRPILVQSGVLIPELPEFPTPRQMMGQLSAREAHDTLRARRYTR